MAVEDGWGNWKHSAGKEIIDKGDKIESGECYGDFHLDSGPGVKCAWALHACKQEIRDEYRLHK